MILKLLKLVRPSDEAEKTLLMACSSPPVNELPPFGPLPGHLEEPLTVVPPIPAPTQPLFVVELPGDCSVSTVLRLPRPWPLSETGPSEMRSANAVPTPSDNSKT